MKNKNNKVVEVTESELFTIYKETMDFINAWVAWLPEREKTTAG